MADSRLEALRRDLRAELRRRGVRRLRSSIWQDLVTSRIVEVAMRDRGGGIKGLADAYFRKLQIYYAPRVARSTVVREVADDGARARVLSEMLAPLIRGICRVDAFREQVLAGKLLAPEELSAWIKAQAEREGPPIGYYVTIPAPIREPHGWLASHDVAAYAIWLAGRAKRVAEEPESELPRGQTLGSLDLEYGPPGGCGEAIVIRGDGMLALLKSVVSGIMGVCAYTGWSERSAVTFVLCGVVPVPPKALVGVHYGTYPAATRIELTVSANMSPAEVAALYQEVRASERGDLERAMDDKHLALALFVDKARESGPRWKETRRRWNEAYPDWCYAEAKDPHARRFALEARRTWSRVTGEAWRDARDGGLAEAD